MYTKFISATIYILLKKPFTLSLKASSRIKSSRRFALDEESTNPSLDTITTNYFALASRGRETVYAIVGRRSVITSSEHTVISVSLSLFFSLSFSRTLTFVGENLRNSSGKLFKNRNSRSIPILRGRACGGGDGGAHLLSPPI